MDSGRKALAGAARRLENANQGAGNQLSGGIRLGEESGAPKPVFIIGSGFSKAFSSSYMPTLGELGEAICNQSPRARTTALYASLARDIERVLSYLAQDMPWKTQQEKHEDFGEFLGLTQFIRDYLVERERAAFQSEIPDWARQFVNFLHKAQAPVLSLNYDTILERLAHDSVRLGPEDVKLRPDELYQAPIAHLTKRTASQWGGGFHPTFNLLKLHGSVNWYWSGNLDSSDQQLYWDPDGISPALDEHNRNMVERNRIDLIPLIVPPVADKSGFYALTTIRALWQRAKRALSQAGCVFCVGSSLPRTDLTLRALLSLASVPSGKVYLVNEAGPDNRPLIQDYESAFPCCEIDKTFMGKDSVSRMVEHLSQRIPVS